MAQSPTWRVSEASATELGTQNGRGKAPNSRTVSNYYIDLFIIIPYVQRRLISLQSRIENVVLCIYFSPTTKPQKCGACHEKVLSLSINKFAPHRANILLRVAQLFGWSMFAKLVGGWNTTHLYVHHNVYNDCGLMWQPLIMFTLINFLYLTSRGLSNKLGVHCHYHAHPSDKFIKDDLIIFITIVQNVHQRIF